ncbi:phenylacetic acid degradation operon negative regulatory protein [Mycobacterium tuberculosis]|nr:phenylacetic acid degradation operon negative regulatory protein [Mycobacterium tuberculosis]
MRPRVKAWRGEWVVLIVTSVGTDARTRAALRTTMHHKRFGELREGVWMRPDNLDLELDHNVSARVRVLSARDDAPAELAAQLWDLSGWAATGHRLLDEMSTAADVPGRFIVAAAMVRHLLIDPMLPAELLPAEWPGAALRAAYHDFAKELSDRRDMAAQQLQEAK